METSEHLLEDEKKSFLSIEKKYYIMRNSCKKLIFLKNNNLEYKDVLKNQFCSHKINSKN